MADRETAGQFSVLARRSVGARRTLRRGGAALRGGDREIPAKRVSTAGAVWTCVRAVQIGPVRRRAGSTGSARQARPESGFGARGGTPPRPDPSGPSEI